MDSSGTQKKEKRGLSKAWRKFKDSFKSQGPTTASTSKPTTTTTTTAAVKSEPAKPAPQAEQPKATTEQQSPPISDVDRRLEKARAIFKKYDFDFDEEEWKKSESRPKEPQERVQKPIRMRVKYTCHECQTTFGRNKTCVKCQHKRCDQCVRYPPKKNKDKSATVAQTDAPATSEATPAQTATVS